MRLLLILIFSIFFYFTAANSATINSFNIKIIGNQNLDKEFIESIINKDAEIEDSEISNYIIKELFSTGNFESVTAEITNDTVIINLVENPVINEILFNGNSRIKNIELKKIIDDNFSEFNVYNEKTTEDISKTLVQYYKAFGYNLIKVTSSIKVNNDNRINIYFDIEEGEITKIYKINIIGNESFSLRKIKSILKSSETKFYKFISYTSKYNKNLIYQDEDRIEEYYKNRGYKNIKVKSSIGEYIKDTNKVILNYFIDEGEKFVINDIKVEFDNELSKDEYSINDKFINDLNIKKNKVYNESRIKKSSEKIYKYLQDQGLVFIEVKPLTDENKNLIDITFFISKIDEIYVSEINILGNTRTKDRVIRRELLLNEGDPFIPSQLEKSQKKISNLNFFSKINIQTQKVKDKVDVEIEVVEKATGEFNIGATYNTFDGVGFLSGLREKNIFGDGRYVEVSLNTTEDNAGINFEVNEPYIRNKKINLLYNVNFTSADRSSASGYTVNTQTAGIGSRYVLADNIIHFIKINYAIKDYTDITSSASDSIASLAGENIEFILINRLSYSTLDSKFRANEGDFIDWYNKISIDNYILNKISYDKYINIDKRVLSIRNEIGNISSLSSDDIQDTSKFTLGGRRLRGFNRSGVGPRNSASGYIGGNNLILSQLDYVVPISESSDNMIDFVTFLDAGKVYSNETDPTSSEESLRVSTGAGFNLNTAIGPLSLTYAVPIQSESYDKERKFVFSIGWVNF